MTVYRNVLHLEIIYFLYNFSNHVDFDLNKKF